MADEEKTSENQDSFLQILNISKSKLINKTIDVEDNMNSKVNKDDFRVDSSVT